MRFARGCFVRWQTIRPRPQSGIAQADLVLEIVVEGGITRYALVFHSQDPDRVGPVRSDRQSDLNYLAMREGGRCACRRIRAGYKALARCREGRGLRRR
jgi:hypothetical protein